MIIRNNAQTNGFEEFLIGAGNGAGPVVAAANVSANTNPHANFGFD